MSIAIAAGFAVTTLTASQAGATSQASATGQSQTCGGTGAVTTLHGALHDKATYLIQCPAGTWNGTLFLYSHGYVPPYSANPAQDVGDPVTGKWLLDNGYALAGSSYATTGWAVQWALKDQISTLDVFDSTYGTPAQTIAWGHSLGGIITAGLVQDNPGRFTAALPMCGVLSGGVATWNTALDAAFAFQKLFDPSIAIVNIANPVDNLFAAEGVLANAQKTPQGRARIALAAALADTPGWYTPLSAEPSATDYKAQEQNQYEWFVNITLPFAVDFRANLEADAGGNPSWNTGVDYVADFAKSADATEVRALYKAAGLSLTGDLKTLQDAKRISADPAAVRYLSANISFDGDIHIPVLTMHTTGDGLVVPENEQAYRAVVDKAGNGNLLEQVFVARAGHCAFTPAETITVAQVLLNRLSTGQWHVPSPAAMNARAAALGSQYNVFDNSKTPPAFTSYRPASYLRPYDLP